MSLPGIIDNTLDYANKITFATNTVLKFTSKTEHDIPKPGAIRIKIPEDCKIVDEPKSSGLELVSFDATDGTIFLGVPDGMKKNTVISYSLSGIRNPRSFKPS